MCCPNGFAVGSIFCGRGSAFHIRCSLPAAPKGRGGRQGSAQGQCASIIFLWQPVSAAELSCWCHWVSGPEPKGSFPSSGYEPISSGPTAQDSNKTVLQQALASRWLLPREACAGVWVRLSTFDCNW